MADTPGNNYEENFFKAPNNASKAFGFEEQGWGSKGASGSTLAPPRPKFLFMVRFVRGAGDGGPAWANGLPIAVKRMDRPTISPQTMTLNQYNKKRIVYTGLKYEPVNIEFHDTVDSLVNYLWYEYSTYHFGDNRRTNEFDWGYDQTGEFRNTGNLGFGVTFPTGGADAPGALEAGNFFSKIECFQFFGAQYVQYDLINPKITRYDPDDFDYEANSAHSIKMSLEYESVIIHNAYSPLPIVSNQDLVEMLGGSSEGGFVKGGVIDGGVYVPPDTMAPSFFGTQIPGFGSISSMVGNVAQKLGVNYSQKYGFLGSTIGGALDKAKTVAGVINTSSSVLNGLGSFDFGSISATGGLNIGNITASADKAVNTVSNIFSGKATQNTYDLVTARSNSGQSTMSAATGLSPTSSTSLGLNNALRGATSSLGLRRESTSNTDEWI